ncbi:MAG: site-2 protease family protein [Georgenia sp.]
MSSPSNPGRTTTGRRTRSGWVLGRVSGTPVVLAPSWLLVAAVLALVYFPIVTDIVPGATVGVALATTGAFVVLLFVSVLVHELAHGLTARTVGARPREYVLTFWGGHTTFDHELPTPGSSALVSVAGPLANVALAVLAWLAIQFGGPGVAVGLVLWGAVLSNGFVAAFNLLPGLPLDGGKALEALVWAVTGSRYRGMVVAAWGGRLVVAGLVAVVVLLPLLRGGQPDLTMVVWVAVLGSMLWSGASAALQEAEQHRAAAGLDLRVLTTPTLTLPADGPLTAVDAALAGRGPTAVVLLHDGAPVGLVDPAAARTVPPEQRGTTPLHAVARTLAPAQIVRDPTGLAALAAVAVAQRSGTTVVLVDGAAVVGVVEVTAVARAMAALRAAPQR